MARRSIFYPCAVLTALRRRAIRVRPCHNQTFFPRRRRRRRPYTVGKSRNNSPRTRLPHPRRFAVVARARALRKMTDGITIRARYVRRHSCVTGKHTHNSACNQTHRKSLRAPPTATTTTTTTSTLNHETTRARVVSLERLNVVIIYPHPFPPVRRLQRVTRVASQHRFLGEMSRNVDDSRDIFRGFCNA